MLVDANALAKVHLTPTERRILETLSGHPGRVYSRKELIDLAIGDSVVSRRTIDVHIRALRRKLGALAAPIRTVRQVGYCWELGR